MCFGNQKLSKKICKILIHGIITNTDFTYIKNYLVVLEPFVTQTAEKNDLPRKRIEWLFGFGFLDEVDSTEGKTVLGLELTFN
jgi:hypothetical protein